MIRIEEYLERHMLVIMVEVDDMDIQQTMTSIRWTGVPLPKPTMMHLMTMADTRDIQTSYWVPWKMNA